MENVIFNHRSIRNYKQDPIPEATLEKILLAGTRASTTGNMQVYSIVSTQKQEIKEQLLGAHFNQAMVKQAPVVLTFNADINRFNKWCKLRGTKPAYDNFLWFMNAAIDTILAAQNVAIAAEGEGLGICYLGTTTYMAAKIIDILKLPIGVVPVTTLVIGYPNENPPLTDRLPLEAILHKDVYQAYTSKKIEDLYAEKEALQSTKDLIETNGTNNLAEIFTEKRYVAKDNLHFSKEFLKVLEKQGFMNNA